MALKKAIPCARDTCGEWFTPLFNVPPTSQVPIIVQASDGLLELSAARWGLIPEWWRKPKPPSATFNARSEEAAEKATWRESLRSARCLMPVRGWYEWNASEPVLNKAGHETHQPYYISCPDAEIIPFAGIWSLWKHPESGPILTCALLTKKSAPGISFIHPRMPVVLTPEQQSAWLDPAASDKTIQQLISGSREDLKGHPVSTQVNKVQTDSPNLLKKVQVHSIDLFG